MPLTSRERVLAVLNHEVPDRVPIILGASNATGISMPTYQKLKQVLGVESPADIYTTCPNSALRGLIDQAESQYWRDAEYGRQQQERCKVAVEVEDLILKDNSGKPVDEDVKKRWLHACVALGFVEINARETTMAFSHQSWGEFFAALRLLDTPPDELAALVKAGVPGAKQKWERAMVRPFTHLNIPVSAEAERRALRERLNQCWAASIATPAGPTARKQRLAYSGYGHLQNRQRHVSGKPGILKWLNLNLANPLIWLHTLKPFRFSNPS